MKLRVQTNWCRFLVSTITWKYHCKPFFFFFIQSFMSVIKHWMKDKPFKKKLNGWGHREKVIFFWKGWDYLIISVSLHAMNRSPQQGNFIKQIFLWCYLLWPLSTKLSHKTAPFEYLERKSLGSWPCDELQCVCPCRAGVEREMASGSATWIT